MSKPENSSTTADLQRMEAVDAHDTAGSSSVFEKDSLWYFHNSAGEQVGPFRYASEAQSNLERLLNSIRDTVSGKQD